MELANQIFFIAFSLIGLGLFLSALYQYRANGASGYGIYWPLSVGMFALSSFSFGIALWTHPFFLTIANTAFIVSVFLLIFLYRSWNQRPFTKIQTLFLWLIPVFIFFFYDYLRVMPGTKEENERITELLKEKERLIYGLLKANKTAATGALSASIAHELNQPLGASNLNIQFLKMKLEKGVLNPDLGKEVLDSLEEDNKRAATIVKSLRSIFNDSSASAEEVPVSELITKVLDIVTPELRSKNIQIQLRVDDDLIMKVNSAEIEQVILNLLNNAGQSLANSGTLQRRITIEAEAIKVGRSIRLSITDNGTGVPIEFKPQLFELLSTTKQTGMGLGLWLCKHIVTRYGGSIHYEDAIGGGARFIVELPSAG
jgi:signal transduction histidine kinase